MNIFIGMETSGELRRRFQAQGHFVVSCDILPAEDGATWGGPARGGHWQGDVFHVFHVLRHYYGIVFDLGIFHPTCTYLTNSAAWAFNDPDYERYPECGYHQRVKPGTLVGAERRNARDAALDDVRRIMMLPIKTKIIENPIGAIGSAIRKSDQIIQPYQFGDDASKATCLWFVDEQGNPIQGMRLPIDPARRFPGRMVMHNGKLVERWSNQTDSGQNRLSPGDDRWKDRSRTFPGIADAIFATFGLDTVINAPLLL